MHLAFSILVHYESLIIPLREVEKSEQEATWLKEWTLSWTRTIGKTTSPKGKKIPSISRSMLKRPQLALFLIVSTALLLDVSHLSATSLVRIACISNLSATLLVPYHFFPNCRGRGVVCWNLLWRLSHSDTSSHVPSNWGWAARSSNKGDRKQSPPKGIFTPHTVAVHVDTALRADNIHDELPPCSGPTFWHLLGDIYMSVYPCCRRWPQV